jgi:hypothetical protein
MQRFQAIASMLLAVLTLTIVAARASEAAMIYNAGPDLLTFVQSPAFATAVDGHNLSVTAWSYGTAPSPLGVPNSAAFSVYTTSEHSANITGLSTPTGALQGWQDPAVIPAVAVNTTGATLTTGCCGSYAAGDIWMHPQVGDNADASIVRWTAPGNGTVVVNAVFNNSGGGVVNEVVLDNGVALANAPTGTALSPFSFAVAAGDHIDFAVVAKDGNGQESTDFHATVAFTAATPEPSSIALLSVALVGIAWTVRRRHV